MDQCMAGLIGPRSGLLVKKPSEFWASDARLVRRLEPLQSDGSHEHAQLDGRTPGIPCDKAKDVARWPQVLCRRLADGCEEVLSEDFGRQRAGGGQSPALPLLTPPSFSFVEEEAANLTGQPVEPDYIRSDRPVDVIGTAGVSPSRTDPRTDKRDRPASSTSRGGVRRRRKDEIERVEDCLLYTSPSPRD